MLILPVRFRGAEQTCTSSSRLRSGLVSSGFRLGNKNTLASWTRIGFKDWVLGTALQFYIWFRTRLKVWFIGFFGFKAFWVEGPGFKVRGLHRDSKDWLG